MAKDPRIKVLADILANVRVERLKRMIEVGDMRRKEGRVSLEEEAAAILSALDARSTLVRGAVL